jgi:hypothetical protein
MATPHEGKRVIDQKTNLNAHVTKSFPTRTRFNVVDAKHGWLPF